jgi:hypothetical protein
MVLKLNAGDANISHSALLVRFLDSPETARIQDKDAGYHGWGEDGMGRKRAVESEAGLLQNRY